MNLTFVYSVCIGRCESHDMCLKIRRQLVRFDSLLSCPKDQTHLFGLRTICLCQLNHFTCLLNVLGISYFSYSVPWWESLSNHAYQIFSSWWVTFPEKLPFWLPQFLAMQASYIPMLFHLSKFYLCYPVAFKYHLFWEVCFHLSSFIFAPSNASVLFSYTGLIIFCSLEWCLIFYSEKWFALLLQLSLK